MVGIDTKKTSNRLSSLYWFLTSLNLAFGLSLAVCLSLRWRNSLHLGKFGSPTLFHEIVTRLNSLFHLNPFDPFGFDVVLTLSTAAAFVLLFPVLRYVSDPRRLLLDLRTGSAIAAFALVPIVWLPYEPSTGAYSLSHLQIWPFAIEFALIGGMLSLSRGRSTIWWPVIALAHYTFCVWLLHEGPLDLSAWPRSGAFMAALWPLFLSSVSPCAGIVWALCATRATGRVGAL